MDLVLRLRSRAYTGTGLDVAKVSDLERNPLLGQAVGDRIGGPIRMAIMLGESVRTYSGPNEADITRRYLAWHQTDAFDTGPIWHKVFSLIETGATAADAARAVHEANGGLTAGTNPAHRATALGCAEAIPLEDLAGAARAEAKLTHWHPEAGEAAAAVALILRHQLLGASLSEAIRATSSLVSGEVARRLKEPDGPQPSGYAPLTLEAALHFAVGHDSFEEAVVASLEFAGPSNYCPVLVGAFAAAEYGYQPISGVSVQPDILLRSESLFEELWSSERRPSN
jgi:ADP-ribosyl-[dinitrogen reductase] hydrolase